MPLILNTPVQETTVDDTVRIESFEVDRINSGGPVCSIHYSVGRMSGGYTPRVFETVTLEAAELASVLLEVTDGTSTVYATIKSKLYGLLQSKGVVGSGSVI